MTKSKFDQIIENRANQRVQEKITQCKKSIFTALNQILDQYWDNSQNRTWPDQHRQILSILASENTKHDWPQTLWQNEKEKVSQELLATMDEMQKALLAPSFAIDDCQSKPEEDQQ